MPLNNDQKCKLFTAGTVTVPSKFPRLGLIRIESGAITFRQGLTADVLHVTETVTDGSVKRTILADKVSAIFVPSNADEPDMKDGEWLFAPEINSANLTSTRKAKNSPADENEVFGIIYVPENQTFLVSTQSESGVMASEEEDVLTNLFAQGECC